MDEAQMQMELEEAIWGAMHENMDEGTFAPTSVHSFEEAGVLTNNKGLVVRMEDGSEFQITIVKSR